jgi:hypothetical protein
MTEEREETNSQDLSSPLEVQDEELSVSTENNCNNSNSDKNTASSSPPSKEDHQTAAQLPRVVSVRQSNQQTFLNEEIIYHVVVKRSHALPKRINEKKLHPTYEVS